MKIIIAGGGKPLFFLCRNFLAKGYDIVIVNQDRNECTQLKRQLSVSVIHGDASNSTILKDAGAMEADAVLAITEKDQDNLVICQLATLSFGVPKAIALANDPDNTEVFEKLGVSSFSTTQIVGSLIEQHASLEQIVNLLPVGEGRVNVTEVALESNAPVIGQRLDAITLPKDALISVILRDKQAIVPRGSSTLENGDRLILITLPKNHADVLRALIGAQE